MSKWPRKVTNKQDDIEMGRLVPDAFPANQKLCWKSELAYFDNFPMSQNCIQASKYIRFDPVTSVTDSSTVFDFVLHPSEDYVFDPAGIRISTELAILKSGDLPVKVYSRPENGTDQQYDPVALVNCPLTSLFHRVEVLINDVPVNSNSGLHHFRAFLELSMNFTYVFL